MNPKDLDREAARVQQAFDEFQMINEKAMETSNAFIKSLLLINGGAIVAVLGFVASLIKTSDVEFNLAVLEVVGALQYFAWGVALASGSFALAYLTHYANLVRINSETKDDVTWNAGNKRLLHIIAAMVSLGSLGTFVCGVYIVKEAIDALVN